MRREFVPPLRRAVHYTVEPGHRGGPELRGAVMVEGDAYCDIHHERVNEFHASEAAGRKSLERLPHTDPKWLFAVAEHTGDLAQMCQHPPQRLETLRYELVRLGATVAGWIDAIDQVASDTDDDEMEMEDAEEDAPAGA